MSKELSPLEECEYLITNAIIHNPYDRKRLWTIHKALKRLETLEEEKQSFDRQLEKKLKALEIIKEKQVDVFIFLHSGDLETYNDMVEDNRKLTQEEYDLLKEELL